MEIFNKFFQNYSSEQFTRIVQTIFMLLALFGFNSEVAPEQVAGAVDSIVVSVALILGVLGNIYGYFRRVAKGDVTLGGFRK